MENRSAQHHKDHLIEAIKEELVILVTGELSDPRIGLVDVNEIIMAPGGKAIASMSPWRATRANRRSASPRSTMRFGYIRHQLADSLSLRVAPDIHFVLDSSTKYGARIDELLHRIDKRGKKKIP